MHNRVLHLSFQPILDAHKSRCRSNWLGPLSLQRPLSGMPVLTINSPPPKTIIATATRLSCLDDTRLQPPDLTLTLGPVDLVPGARLAGGCTRRLLCVHLLFPPVKVLPVLSSRTTNWKSVRLHGGVMLQLLSAPLQNGLGFFQHPLPVIPSAFIADAPAPEPGRNAGFTMLVSNDTNELIPASHTGSLECPCVPSVRWNNRLHRRFWPEPDSVFGSLSMTVPIAVHFCWTYHSACPSDHIDARSRGNLLITTMEGCCLGSFRPDRYQSHRCQ